MEWMYAVVAILVLALAAAWEGRPSQRPRGPQRDGRDDWEADPSVLREWRNGR